MSMRGELISKEYQRLVFIEDRDGKEYSCYSEDVKDFNQDTGLTDTQRARCLDLSLVLGDNW